MAKAESTTRNSADCLNVDFMRSLVKQYTELVNIYFIKYLQMNSSVLLIF